MGAETVHPFIRDHRALVASSLYTDRVGNSEYELKGLFLDSVLLLANPDFPSRRVNDLMQTFYGYLTTGQILLNVIKDPGPQSLAARTFDEVQSKWVVCIPPQFDLYMVTDYVMAGSSIVRGAVETSSAALRRVLDDPDMRRSIGAIGVAREHVLRLADQMEAEFLRAHLEIDPNLTLNLPQRKLLKDFPPASRPKSSS